MENNRCKNCGAPISDGSNVCQYCGAVFDIKPADIDTGVEQQNINSNTYNTMPQQNSYNNVYREPAKNKIAAGLLGILLGGFGIHKFYLGKIGQGILYILFCWTGIPLIVGFIEGIVYLCTSDERWLARVGYKY